MMATETEVLLARIIILLHQRLERVMQEHYTYEHHSDSRALDSFILDLQKIADRQI